MSIKKSPSDPHEEDLDLNAYIQDLENNFFEDRPWIKPDDDTYRLWINKNEIYFSKFDIDRGDILRAAWIGKILVAADQDYYISCLCLKLMRLLAERKSKAISGSTHDVSNGRAISDALVNELISVVLSSIHPPINRDLLTLLNYQLCGSIDPLYKRRKRIVAQDVVEAAVKLSGDDITPSYRKIAREFGVNQATIHRAFPQFAFQCLKAILKNSASTHKDNTLLLFRCAVELTDQGRFTWERFDAALQIIAFVYRCSGLTPREILENVKTNAYAGWDDTLSVRQ